jgi:glutamyl-tRNA reductase
MLILLGSNHRSAPVDVRERMSFPLQRLPEAHAEMMRLEGIAEGMILSTCNRVEILARADNSAKLGLAALKRFLAEQHSMPLEEIERYTYQFHDDDAIRHLFSVASGLDSMIMGEPQILGQVKQAYQFAKEYETIGPVVDRLMQHCLSAAKKVRTETGISRNAVSVAFAAVELARKIFGDLKGRSAMLLGAGKMGDLVGRHLVANGVAELTVCSRTYTNAVIHAQGLGGKPLHWDDGPGKLRDVDIVVSCTGAPQVILTKKDVSRSLRGRKIGPLFLIDIAVPRDIDPKANDLDNVYLYDIDALQGVIESNMEERRSAAERAKKMVAKEVASFDRWLQTQEVTPMIVSLRETLLGVGEQELTRLQSKLGQLDDQQHRAVEELARGIIQKILHRPIRRLRASVERGDMLECATLYREIFGIDEGRAASGSAEAKARGAAGEAKSTPRPTSGPQRVVDGGKKGT